MLRFFLILIKQQYEFFFKYFRNFKTPFPMLNCMCPKGPYIQFNPYTAKVAIWHQGIFWKFFFWQLGQKIIFWRFKLISDSETWCHFILKKKNKFHDWKYTFFCRWLIFWWKIPKFLSSCIRVKFINF